MEELKELKEEVEKKKRLKAELSYKLKQFLLTWKEATAETEKRDFLLLTEGEEVTFCLRTGEETIYRMRVDSDGQLCPDRGYSCEELPLNILTQCLQELPRVIREQLEAVRQQNEELSHVLESF